MEADFLELFAQALEREPGTVRMADSFWEYEEWDSLSVLALLEAINDRYELTIPRSDLMEFRTVADMYAYVVENGRNGPSSSQ
ncbi:MAG: acyl carrier protein [bacterium]